MSPKNVQEISDEASSIVAPRPPPLRINKHSHHIRKQPVLRNNSAPAHPHRPPVIIYTHPPKVIHTKPSDFMALVQKLTGLSPNSQESDQVVMKSEPEEMDSDEKSGSNESHSSGVTDGKVQVREVKQEPTMMFDECDEWLGDVAGPNSGDFLYSMFQWPATVNPVSPSLVELMNRIP